MGGALSSDNPEEEATHAAASDAHGGRPRGKTMGRRSTFKYLGGQKQETSTLAPSATKNATDTQFISDVLRGNPNLQRLVKLGEKHIEELIQVAWKEDFLPGQILMSEGDLSNEVFFIVQSGSFEIVSCTPFEIVHQKGISYLLRPEEPAPIDENHKTTEVVGSGLCIGDRSMVFNQPRLVTATARETSTVWAISQADFTRIQREALQACEEQSTPTGKSEEEAKLLADALQFNANLQRLVPLNSEHIKQVLQIACREELAEGQVLMYEGDLNAEAFYIVGSGKLEACGSEPFEVIQDGQVSYFHRAAHTGQVLSTKVQEKTIKVVEKGHCFGEISMLHCAPRFATLRALEKTVLWVIDRSNFQIVQMKGAEEHMKNRVKYLEGLEACSNLPHGGIESLAGLMDMMRFHKDEVILHRGATGTALYILYEGQVEVQSPGEGTGGTGEGDSAKLQVLEANTTEGTHHYFGEKALKKDQQHPATVRVTSDTATVLALQRADFMSVWDQVIEGASAPAFERLYTRVGPRKDALCLTNLKKVGLLGAASFGPVDLVKHTSTGATYALKSMSKGLVARRGMISAVAQEKDVWEMLASPFIIKLEKTFMEAQSFHLLLELAQGGELSQLYDTHSLYGSVEHSKYYLAGIALAFDCLHRFKVAYRNLKPQNILLSCQGHPKVTDMGLAKVVIGQTFTMCGTPNYMAPEVLAGTGHARAVDWWSLGSLAFELMAGRTPFESDHPMRVYSNVMRGIARVEFPEACSGPVGDLIRALLKPQAIERLPMRMGGFNNVVDHTWFSGFNWKAMQTQSLKPPHIPKLQGDEDLSCFAPYADNVPQAGDDELQEDHWESEFGP